MKYQIEDIKEGVEFIIDDDKTFDKLIEFYLPFRVSELTKLDTNKTGDAFFSQFAEFFEFDYPSERYDWADKVANAVNWEYSVLLYVALATYADKNKTDRALALDIIYCLIGLTNHQGFDDLDKHSVCSHITIAEQVAIQWEDYEVARFLVESALEDCYTPFDLEQYLDSSFWGVLSDLVGVESYFGHITEMIKEDEEYFFGWGEEEIYFFSDSIVPLAQKSLRYLDDDAWARDLYKKTLNFYSVSDTEPECILEISKSIIKDLKDKKWGEELANSLSIWNDKKEVLAAVKNNGNRLAYASEELKADKEVVLAAVNNWGYDLSDASEELKADKEVVLAAVKNLGVALEYASKELKADKEVVMAAVSEDEHVREYPDSHYYSHIKMTRTALEYASKELKSDKEVALAAVTKNGHNLEYVSKELCADREVVLAAVKDSGYALRHASEELKNDPEFMKEVEQYF